MGQLLIKAIFSGSLEWPSYTSLTEYCFHNHYISKTNESLITMIKILHLLTNDNWGGGGIDNK